MMMNQFCLMFVVTIVRIKTYNKKIKAKTNRHNRSLLKQFINNGFMFAEPRPVNGFIQ